MKREIIQLLQDYVKLSSFWSSFLPFDIFLDLLLNFNLWVVFTWTVLPKLVWQLTSVISLQLICRHHPSHFSLVVFLYLPFSHWQGMSYCIFVKWIVHLETSLLVFGNCYIRQLFKDTFEIFHCTFWYFDTLTFWLCEFHLV